MCTRRVLAWRAPLTNATRSGTRTLHSCLLTWTDAANPTDAVMSYEQQAGVVIVYTSTVESVTSSHPTVITPSLAPSGPTGCHTPRHVRRHDTAELDLHTALNLPFIG
jgi:hypothetical protein